jgi:hypothetical protein
VTDDQAVPRHVLDDRIEAQGIQHHVIVRGACEARTDAPAERIDREPLGLVGPAQRVGARQEPRTPEVAAARKGVNLEDSDSVLPQPAHGLIDR